MSGEFPYHISLTNLTEPKGLHRTAYQLIPEKKDDFINNDDAVESCFKKIIYRYNRCQKQF